MPPDPKPNKNLTTTQEERLAVYRRLIEKHGEPPSVREFAAAIGTGHNAAHRMIQQFREKGYLSMRPVTIIRPTLTAKGRAAK